MTSERAIEIIWEFMKSDECIESDLFDACQLAINALHDGRSEPYRPDRTTCWVSVEEGLPEKGQETWVYALPPEGIDAEPEIDTDTYEGNRGEIVKYTCPLGDGEEPTSGWYTYSGWNVTHWMPIVKPEAPV